MSWSDGGAAAAVEGGDLDDVEAFGYGDDGGVGGAEREAGTGLHEFGGAVVVGEFEVDDRDRAGDDRTQERCLDRRAAGAGAEVADFGDDRVPVRGWACGRGAAR